MNHSFVFTEIAIAINFSNVYCRQAYMLVQQRRFCISPNEGFIIQLREYEPIYKAEKMLKNSQQNLESQCSKRTIHQIDLDNQQDKIEDVTNS